MSNLIKGNQKHLTLENRIFIEKSLDQGMKFNAIAKELHKDPSSISKEIRLHRSLLTRNDYNQSANRCKYRQSCIEKNLCGKSILCIVLCKNCLLRCNKICSIYVKDECTKLLHPPFVCNYCSQKHGCRFDKYYYRSNQAHSQYRTLLSSSREGINLSPEALAELDSIISPAVLKGQSISHILATHKDSIPYTSRTIYNYIEHNVLSVRNLDLPRR